DSSVLIAQGSAKAEAANTSDIRTAVSTIAHSVSAEAKAHKIGVALVVSGLIVTSIAAVVGVSKFLSRNRVPTVEVPQILRNTQVLFAPDLDTDPTLSPDGNSVAYASDQTGKFEIYVEQLTAGGREIQLSSNGQQNLQPAWSPDGQRIAYFSRNGGGIWIVPALGGSPKQLTD